jgi:hypothetical protein
MLIPQFVGEGKFGAGLPRYVVDFGEQLRAPFGVTLQDFSQGSDCVVCTVIGTEQEADERPVSSRGRVWQRARRAP